jgi:3-(methylthio)propanoyl-CoA dehydrogenase
MTNNHRDGDRTWRTFFTDNEDIRFLLEHIDLRELADVQEDGFDDLDTRPDYAPRDVDEAIDNYHRILDIVGQISGRGDRAERRRCRRRRQYAERGRDGHLPSAAAREPQAAVASRPDGLHLPYRFGGLNCPNLIYTVATEIVSRADGSLQNIFGLQGIAETINAFANEEIKGDYLPRFSCGEVTGAMVLTEPDAGSDLQAIRLRADLDDQGVWRLNGVKRFITNGCGEVLLTLARSEHAISDGRGIEPVRLGTHRAHQGAAPGEETGHPRFADLRAGLHQRPGAAGRRTAARLDHLRPGPDERRPRQHCGPVAGDRRSGVPAGSHLRPQPAAVRRADRTPAGRGRDGDRHAGRDPGRSGADLRDQPHLRSGEQQPAGAGVQAARKRRGEAAEEAEPRAETRQQHADADEQVLRQRNVLLRGRYHHPGPRRLGVHADYPAERYLRDARITTIYEGTSQLQIVAASRGVSAGVFDGYVERFETIEYEDPQLQALKQKLLDAKQPLSEAISFVKGRSPSFLDLMGRRLVDCAILQICGHLLLQQAVKKPAKKVIARRYIDQGMTQLRMKCEQIMNADTSPLDQFETAGPVPSSH